MPSPRVIACLFISFSITLIASSSAQAGEYRSEKGYHLNYPDDWQIATGDQQQAVEDGARQLLHNVDFTRMDAVFYKQSDATQNVNIIVAPGSVPSGQEGVPVVESALRDQFTSAGMTVEGLECKLVHLGNNDAISSTWTASMPAFGSQKMQQRQVLIAGKSHGYIITCTVPVGSAAAAETSFGQILGSFQIDAEPDRTPGEWWDSLSGAARNGIIGGCIGLGFAFFSSLAKAGAGKR